MKNVTIKTHEVYAIIKGGNPFYRRSYSVERIEIIADSRLHDGHGVYAKTIHDAENVVYKSLDDAKLEMAVKFGGIYATFADAWRIVCQMNTTHGLPLGQEMAFN